MNPVDLRGKKGVIDPEDLKKDNPKPPKVEKVAPPPPETKKVPKNSVDSSSDTAKSPPSDEGGKPGGGDVGVKTQPPKVVLPRGRGRGR